MRKIGFFNYISFFSISAIFGIAASVGLIFLTKPFPAQVQNIPVVSFNNAELYRHNVETKADPFSGPLADLFAPPKPVSPPPMPKIAPGQAERQISESERIYVIGVMPPDTCILRRGGEVLTVISGEKSPFGAIGNVTAEGVYVDGKFYKMGSGL